jgi:hypothetical protein
LDTIAKGEASPTASALATACRRHRQTLRERNAKGKASPTVQVLDFGFKQFKFFLLLRLQMFCGQCPPYGLIDFGFWILDFGFKQFKFFLLRLQMFCGQCPPYGLIDFGFWILDFGFKQFKFFLLRLQMFCGQCPPSKPNIPRVLGFEAQPNLRKLFNPRSLVT